MGTITSVVDVMMSFLARWWGGYLGVIGLAAIDQFTKIIMLELIFSPPRVITILPFLNFSPAYNTGISFGMFGNSGTLGVVVLTIFAVAVGVLLPYISRDWLPVGRWGAIMMAGGAIGNAVDRIRLGKVVDFIDVHAAGWHWPAFNIADSVIVIGVGFMLFSSWRQSHDNSNQSQDDEV
jgi:signal peptidase II